MSSKAQTSAEREEDPPPPYSPGQTTSAYSNHWRVVHDHTADSSRTFDSIQKNIVNARHSYDLRWESESYLSIYRAGDSEQKLFHLSLSNSSDVCAAVFWENTSHIDHAVAQARPMQPTGDFDIRTTPKNMPDASDWTPVSCVKGSLMHPDSYHFTVGQRRLAWKHGHGSHIDTFPKLHRDATYTLEDESEVGNLAPVHKLLQDSARKRVIVGGNEIATYRASAGAKGQLQGLLHWTDEFGMELELCALIALVMILRREYKRTKP